MLNRQSPGDEKKTKDQLLIELRDIREHVKDLEQKMASNNDVLEILKKSEKQFRLIAENAIDNISIVSFDLKAKYEYVSPSVKLILGYDPEDLVGKSFFDFIHPIDKKNIFPLLKKYVGLKLKDLLKGNESKINENIEFRFKNKEGNWQYIQSNLSIVKKKILSIARDITEQKKIEKELQDSEDKFKRLWELTFEGILINKEGIAVDTNISFNKMFGYNMEELLGKDMIKLLVPETYHSIVYENIKKNYAAPYEIECIKKDGSIIPVEIESRDYHRSKDNILRVTAFRDITERKRTEKILSQSVILDAINRILQESISSETDFQVASVCLKVAEKLTDSKFGFIGEINKNGKLDTIAMSNPEKMNCTMSDSNANILINNMEIRGVWGIPIIKGHSVIVNNPESLSDNENLPEGHPPIISFLCVLLKFEEKKFGVIALANKEGGYSKFDQEKIEALAVPFVEALTRKRMVLELKTYQEHLETMVEERSEKLAKSNAQLMSEVRDRMKSEISLRESESHYRQLFDLLPYGGELLDTKGNILDCSLSTAKMLGYERDELIGMHITRYLDKDSIQKYKERFQKLLEGEPLSVEATMIHKSGKELYVLRAAEAIFGSDGNIESILALSMDISKRKKAEEKLMQSEKDYRELFDNSSDAIYIQDENGRFLDVNQGVVEMYGYPKDFFIGKTPEFLSAPGKNDMQIVIKAIEDAFMGIPRQFDFWGIRKNGEIFPKIVRCKSGFYMGRKVIVTFAIDITDRYNAENERTALEEQLQQAQKMEAIGTLAGGIAHDFNNILGAIIGYTDLTLKNPYDATQVRKYMNNVMNASVRAKDMVRQILAFSRKHKSKFSEVFLSKIIGEAIRFLRSSLPATIDIKTDIEDDLGPIFADPTQITQILMNLCTNSSYAMKEDGGLLQILLQEINVTPEHPVMSLEPGTYQIIGVQDFGSGIDDEVLKKIFEPYFTTKEVGEGTGMGLAVVYGIVKGYGGEIEVKSAIGKGTIFNIYLPVIKDYHLGNEDKEEVMGIEGGNETILFVDDEDLIVEMNNELLSQLGYSIESTTDSLNALDIFKSDPDKYDLLITDMTMPNMTGSKLTVEVHKIRPDLPVIVCTGYSDNIDDENFKSLGVSALVMKPTEIKDFLKVIRRVLNDKKAVDSI